MRIIRRLAIISNCALMAFTAYSFLKFGWPDSADEDVFVVLLIVAPLASLLCLFFLGGSKAKNDSLLSIWVETRKARLKKELREIEEPKT